MFLGLGYSRLIIINFFFLLSFLMNKLACVSVYTVAPQYNEPLYNEVLDQYNERFSSARPKL